MTGTLASIERTVDVDVAVNEVQRVLRRYGALRYGAVSQRFPHQFSARLETPGGEVVSSRGKGPGSQGIASALFELLEHAVSMGVVDRCGGTEAVKTKDLYAGGDIPRDWLGQLVFERGAPMTVASQFSLVGPAGQGEVWLPTAIYDEAPYEDDQVLALAARYWSSNGYAAGMTVADASLHAVNEVIERDALSNFIIDACFGRAVGADIDLDGHPTSLLRERVQTSTGSDVDIRLLPSLTGTVCLATGDRFGPDGRRLIGMGSSAHIEYAVERALLEYEQECAVEDEIAAGGIAADEDDIVDGASELLNHPFLGAGYQLQQLPPLAAEPVCITDQPRCAATHFQSIADTLAAAGFPVLRRVLHHRPHRSKVAPTVVQVVVIGAEKFHLVRLGLDVEPIARLRKPETVNACRAGFNPPCTATPISTHRRGT